MQIGIGLPNTTLGAEGDTLIEWARRADQLGFSSLATIGRIAYPGFEELITLAAAAAVTNRVGLLTNILLGPTRNPVLLAKEAASIDRISGGRLTLGLGVGFREDDYQAVEESFHDRGRRMDQMIETMRGVWSGEAELGDRPVGPRPTRTSGIPILIGGMSDRALQRTVRYGDGWTAGGSAADQVGPFAERVRAAWKGAGRQGEPRIVALSYFALGDGAESRARASLTDYYGEYGNQMVQFIPKTPDALRETVKRFEDARVDELVLDPTIPDPDQVNRVAEAVL
jgi:alkanesulfonate monooxygenase SsuD/methylene tetrahydromethanopterin reductase-like flavin-dependent oxidoreductase (luciferase family)